MSETHQRLGILVRRAVIVAVALSAGLALGARSPSSRATPWVASEFKGPSRSVLTIQESRGSSAEISSPPTDVYVASVYGTEISSFAYGVLVRTSFVVPDTGDVATLIVDLNRHGSRTRWAGDDDGQVRARFYIARSSNGEITLDARAVSGDLRLDAIAIINDAIGFRVRGWLELVDPGPDGRLDTGDDHVVDVELAIETRPTPEAIAAGRPEPSTLPAPGFCEWPSCYEDPGYYYDPYGAEYAPACGHVDVGYSDYDYDDGSGCDGEPYLDGEGEELDDPEWDDEVSGGCDGSPPDEYEDVPSDGCGDTGEKATDDSGCESDYDDSSSSGGGCESSDDSAGEGCGGSDSGCEGDTYDQQGAGSERPAREASVVRLGGATGWLPIALLFAGLIALHRRRP